MAGSDARARLRHSNSSRGNDENVERESGGADHSVRLLGEHVRRTIGDRHDDEQVDVAVRRRFAASLRAEEIDHVGPKVLNQALNNSG